jgi:hypothetical protein
VFSYLSLLLRFCFCGSPSTACFALAIASAFAPLLLR